MPVPDFTDPDRSTRRLVIQVIIAACFIICAAVMMFYAWHVARNSVMVLRTAQSIDHMIMQQSAILDKQSAILNEIKDARAMIPFEVKDAVKAPTR
jgi:Na+-translocating ferredoxin:NAD+ oxidoreductase RnfD subunit